MRLVENSKADLAVGGVVISNEKSKDFNFSYPYMLSEVTILSDKPKPIFSSMALLYPLSFTVWMSLAVLFLFVSILFFGLMKRKYTFNSIIMKVFSSLLEKSINIDSLNINLRIFLCSWILPAFAITNSYKGVLLASLSVPLMVGIRDIPDLAKAAEKNSVTCYTRRGSGLNSIFLESDIYS